MGDFNDDSKDDMLGLYESNSTFADIQVSRELINNFG